MALYRRGEVWWCDITLAGQRVRRSLGTDSRQEAIRRERDLIAKHRANPTGKTLHDALALWLDERPRGRSDISILDRISGKPNIALANLRASDIRSMLSGLSAGNYNRHIAVVRSALNLALAHGWIAAVPHLEKRREPPPKERWLTREEWAQLRKHLPDHLRDIADFAIATGLRLSNILTLEWRQVDLERRTAFVAASQAKGRRAIPVPLSDAAVAVLRAQIGHHETRVFTHGKKKRKPYSATPKTAWQDAVKAAGLEGVTFHTLRHTWATWHVQNGTPLAILQKLGGWASLAMVQRYAHHAPEHLAAYAGNATVTAQKRRKAA